MSTGGSQKPTDIPSGEEAKVVLHVPEIVTLSDDTQVLIRRLKLREIMLYAPTFLSALSGLTGEKAKEGVTDAEKSKGGFLFLGKMLSATWEPTIAMLDLATNRSAAEYEEMEADDMLKVVRVFVRLHKRVASTFFGVLEEAGFPVAAMRAWGNSLKTSMTSLGEDTASKK